MGNVSHRMNLKLFRMKVFKAQGSAACNKMRWPNANWHERHGTIQVPTTVSRSLCDRVHGTAVRSVRGSVLFAQFMVIFVTYLVHCDFNPNNSGVLVSLSCARGASDRSTLIFIWNRRNIEYVQKCDCYWSLVEWN